MEDTVELPQLHLVELRTGCCMPVVCNDRCRVVRSAETALVPQLQCSDMVSGDFLGPCTQVQGRGSCPRGHGPNNLVHLVRRHGINISSLHLVCTSW